MSRFVKFTLGAVMGGMVFGLVALLLAPATGKELRARIRKSVTDATDDVRQAAILRRQELEEELASLRLSATKK